MRIDRLAAALGAAGLLTFGASAPVAAGVVHVAQGDLTGVTEGKVESFKGVPFAAPPVGDARWRPPGPAPAWSGVKAADAFGPICMQAQRPGFSQAMSEDCLTLNVWRPAGAKAGDKLPVMVWIYGGGFIFGGSPAPIYDGTHFAEDGVILVSFNYRVGKFGFFAHPALDKGPGPVANYGLMDQIAALKWVKRNIAAFGGDPANVTMFGESAGAISVNYLMGSPAAHNLFDKAISESGFGRSEPRPLKGADRSAEALGEAFAAANGIKGEDDAAAKALRALPASALGAPTRLGDPSFAGISLDGQIVTQGIAEAFVKGEEAHVPYMEGGNSYEASLFPQIADNPGPEIARLGEPAKVEAAYGGKPGPEVAREILTDTMITEPDRHLARQMARQGLPAYVYHFSYVATGLRDTSFGQFGASHGSEISYVFGTLRDTPINFGGREIPAATPEDHTISKAMHAYWVAFAKTGSPDSAGGPAWPRYEVASDEVIQFGEDGVHLRHDFDKARLDLIEASLANRTQSAAR
jgi:para-nitrobenzyl esterase